VFSRPCVRTKNGRTVIYYHGCTELVTGTPDDLYSLPGRNQA